MSLLKQCLFNTTNLTLQFVEDCLKNLTRCAGALQIRCKEFSFPDDLVNSNVQSVSAFGVSEVAKHQGRGPDGSQRVGNTLALNIRCGAMDADC